MYFLPRADRVLLADVLRVHAACLFWISRNIVLRRAMEDSVEVDALYLCSVVDRVVVLGDMYLSSTLFHDESILEFRNHSTVKTAANLANNGLNGTFDAKVTNRCVSLAGVSPWCKIT